MLLAAAMRFLGMKYSLRSVAPAAARILYEPNAVLPCCSVIGLWSRLLALNSLLAGLRPYCFFWAAFEAGWPCLLEVWKEFDCISMSSLVLPTLIEAPFLISWIFGLNFLVDLILKEALISAD